MSYLEQEASRIGDIEDALPVLNVPMERQTLNNVLYLMHVLARAQDAIERCKDAMYAQGLPVDKRVFAKCFWAIEGVHATVSPLVLSNSIITNARGNKS